MHDGRVVAVKVRYPWLELCLEHDLALARRLLLLWTWATGRDRGEP